MIKSMEGFIDPILLNQLGKQIDIMNATLTRRQLAERVLDPRRDIDEECGYPSTTELTSELYRRLYDREAVAARVVDVLAEESWQVQPMVFETRDIGDLTDFEQAWLELGRNTLGDEPSYFQNDEGEDSSIWEFLTRVDRLSGIGRYGVVLLGVDDGKDLEEPLEVTKEKELNLVYLRVFDESIAKITRYETAKNSRFTKPLMYDITFTDPKLVSSEGAGVNITNKKVHHSRIIHVAGDILSSETFGIPRMQQVYNNLYNLRKLYGGSAEMYWKGAFPGISYETHPSLGGDVVIDKAETRDEIEQMMNGLQRFSVLKGITANSLAPQVVDPTPQIDAQITAICIKLGIPKRKFMGTERGELSSSQDDGDWNDLLRSRQRKFITPRIIVPFIDKLINLGILPTPKRFAVEWPDLENVNDMDRATIAVKKTEALVKFIAGGGEALYHPLDFLVQWMEHSPDEAVSILKRATDGVGDPNVDDIDLDETRESIKGATHTNDPNLAIDPAIKKETKFSSTPS